MAVDASICFQRSAHLTVFSKVTRDLDQCGTAKPTAFLEVMLAAAADPSIVEEEGS